MLLTGARAPVTLEICRALRYAGHRVLLADSLRFPLARWSGTASRYFRVAAPAHQPEKFVADLVSITRQQRVDVVVPTCEEIFFIASRLNAFPPEVKIFAEPIGKLQPMHDKWEFIQSLSKAAYSISIPMSYRLTSRTELQAWLDRRPGMNWVYKPVYSRFAARTLIAPELNEVAGLVPTMADAWVVQQLIVGQEYSTCSIVKCGRLRSHVCYRSSYRAGRGSGIYFFSEEVPVILSFVEQFAFESQYTGMIGFDFIQQADGRAYVIECNPRATSGMHLLSPAAIADALMNPVGSLHKPLSTQPKMLASVMPLYALPQAIRQSKLFKLMSDVLGARDVIFRWRDPMPGLMAPISLLEVISKSLRTGAPLTQAATSDIEWNGEPL